MSAAPASPAARPMARLISGAVKVLCPGAEMNGYPDKAARRDS
jgi:hypothetical protein